MCLYVGSSDVPLCREFGCVFTQGDRVKKFYRNNYKKVRQFYSECHTTRVVRLSKSAEL